jgi:hypothetical protein
MYARKTAGLVRGSLVIDVSPVTNAEYCYYTLLIVHSVEDMVVVNP